MRMTEKAKKILTKPPEERTEDDIYYVRQLVHLIPVSYLTIIKKIIK